MSADQPKSSPAPRKPRGTDVRNMTEASEARASAVRGIIKRRAKDAQS